jgi:hypothetical protein
LPGELLTRDFARRSLTDPPRATTQLAGGCSR